MRASRALTFAVLLLFTRAERRGIFGNRSSSVRLSARRWRSGDLLLDSDGKSACRSLAFLAPLNTSSNAQTQEDDVGISTDITVTPGQREVRLLSSSSSTQQTTFD